jgi:hypothetical protein
MELRENIRHVQQGARDLTIADNPKCPAIMAVSPAIAAMVNDDPAAQ